MILSLEECLSALALWSYRVSAPHRSLYAKLRIVARFAEIREPVCAKLPLSIPLCRVDGGIAGCLHGWLRSSLAPL
jgi:hypothetical protein